MTLSGIGTVAKQEFRVRLRTGRWRWLLVAWVAIIGLFAALLRLGLYRVEAPEANGIPLFGGIMLFVLGLALLVAPALTSVSINGDRERGTLATVQVTRLSAGEIALGKLAAAWGTALAFLALTLPFVVWSLFEGGVGIGRAAFVLMIVALLVGVVCAVAQGLSALFARSITSTLMSYLTVFALTVGTLIAFGLALTMTVRTEQKTVQAPASAQSGETGAKSYQSREPHPEQVWWLLAPNPFVVLADSAPQPPMRFDQDTRDFEPATELDPLSVLGLGVRQARLAPDAPPEVYASPSPKEVAPPIWPYGLAFDVLLGAGAVWISARRLRTPVHKLSRGVRIA